MTDKLYICVYRLSMSWQIVHLCIQAIYELYQGEKDIAEDLVNVRKVRSFTTDAVFWLLLSLILIFYCFFFLYHGPANHPEVTLCGWQDVKVQLLSNLQELRRYNPDRGVTLCGSQDVKVQLLCNWNYMFSTYKFEGRMYRLMKWWCGG